jgi:hypothetical protein
MLLAGLASSIDYALSVKKPLGICDSSWFRHIYSEDIDVYKTNINEIISKSSYYCDKYLNLLIKLFFEYFLNIFGV